ncbi:hypothetical protein Ancab_018981 [Ancistrocladus abbreviatus]
MYIFSPIPRMSSFVSYEHLFVQLFLKFVNWGGQVKKLLLDSLCTTESSPLNLACPCFMFRASLHLFSVVSSFSLNSSMKDFTYSGLLGRQSQALTVSLHCNFIVRGYLN